MAYEQVFEKSVDTEHLFVLHYGQSEHLFGKGDAMSVALEIEYEEFYPRLRVVPDVPGRRTPTGVVTPRRLVVAIGVAVLLVLLMLPIRALGGRTIAGAAPVAGQVYVVQRGDTLGSIAARADAGQAPLMAKRLAAEVGSTVVVPGEHLLIP
jgi:hypothetical protein